MLSCMLFIRLTSKTAGFELKTVFKKTYNYIHINISGIKGTFRLEFKRFLKLKAFAHLMVVELRYVYQLIVCTLPI